METKDLKIIGLNIKAERVKKELSQEQLAELINTSRNTISLIERGKQNLSILKFIYIAKVLNININELIKGL